MREDCTTPNNSPQGLETLKQLFNQYRCALIVEAQLILHDIWEAEDVVQDTFIVLWEKDHLMNVPPEKHKSYIFCAVRNNCLSLQRKLQTAEKKKAHYLETAPQYDMSDQGEAWEVRSRINEAVQELPEQRRLAFIKAHLHQKTYREVGAEMGLKMETVRSHVKIALRNLRGMLKHLK
ncbi:sigma-70 family RNA polymerase sigma factor [Chitinophaga barathri]|nr:sigma-70 family RNA polymerase sigma factor [Chitinophaga barathri]